MKSWGGHSFDYDFFPLSVMSVRFIQAVLSIRKLVLTYRMEFQGIDGHFILSIPLLADIWDVPGLGLF